MITIMTIITIKYDILLMDKQIIVIIKFSS